MVSSHRMCLFRLAGSHINCFPKYHFSPKVSLNYAVSDYYIYKIQAYYYFHGKRKLKKKEVTLYLTST